MDFSTALMALVGRGPSILLEIVAIVLAVSRWQRHPTVSMLVVVGVIIQFFVGVAYTVLPMVMAQRGGIATSQIGLFMMPLSIIGTGGYALIIGAVFFGRAAPGTEAPGQRW